MFLKNIYDSGDVSSSFALSSPSEDQRFQRNPRSQIRKVGEIVYYLN